MDKPIFRYHTEPYQHQDEVFKATRDLRSYALFWEMGTGKTKIAVDTATWLYLTGKIDAVLVTAPTGIHANWDVPGEGIRRHLSPELLEASERLTWDAGRAGKKAFDKQHHKLMTPGEGMRWLFIGFDAMITKKGYAAAKDFLQQYRCLWVIDEAGRIKNPIAARTKACMKLRDLARYYRPMTGTPVAQKPFDVFALIHWMDPSYWRKQGIGSYFAFKHTFGEWRKIRVNQGREVEVQRTDSKGNAVYKNLDELALMLKPVSSRLLKDDVLDLPPKVYTTAYYDLGKRQLQLYEEMERDHLIWYQENSAPIDPNDPDSLHVLTCSADLAIVQQLRLQQLALGYIVPDEGEVILLDENPALDLLKELVADIDHPVIIWGRFRRDIDLIMAALGEKAVRYDGSTSPEERIAAVQDFQAGRKQFFVATQSTAGEGLTLTAARTTIYYSNSRKLTERLQSEDRNHRIGQSSSVQYIDIVGRNTISELILQALRHNEEVAANALGDRLRKKYGG